MADPVRVSIPLKAKCSEILEEEATESSYTISTGSSLLVSALKVSILRPKLFFSDYGAVGFPATFAVD